MKQFGTKNVTYTQRLKIETLYNAGLSVIDIAKEIGVSRTTIYNELRRGAYEHKIKRNDFWYGDSIKYVTKYSADISQQRYKSLCTKRGRPIKLGKDFALVEYIEKRVLKDKISACAVLGEIKRNNLPYTSISKTTLYRYIANGYFYNIKLAKRKSTTRKVVVIKRVSRGTSIEKRPIEIGRRQTFGHWEMDCVCGPTKSTILVLSERLTRKEILFKMNNQKSDSVIACIDSLERKLGSDTFTKLFKSITVDNGSEFANYKMLERSLSGGKRTSIYYCHPYCSSERGTNERLNREIRRLIPKGSDISKLSNSYISFVEDWLNNYPRGVLGFSTSAEEFNKYYQTV